MMPWDFIQRLNGEEFQQYLTELLVSKYPDFQTVDDTRGDKGCDGLAVNATLYFQIYAPQGFGTEPHKQKKIKDKIGDSLNLFRKYPIPTVKQIIFIISCEPEMTTVKYFLKKKKELSPIILDIWGIAKVCAISSEYRHIAKTWNDKFNGSTGHLDVVGAEAYKAKDRLGPMSRLLETIGAPWKDSRLMQSYIMEASFGKSTKLMFKPNPDASPDADKLEIDIVFDSNYATQNRQMLNNLFRSNSEIHFTGEQIKKVDFRIGRNILETVNEISSFVLTPSPGYFMSSTIKFIKNKKVLYNSKHTIAFKEVDDKSHMITKIKKEESDYDYNWTFTNGGDSHRWSTKASFNLDGTNTLASLDFLNFYIAMHKANAFSIEFDPSNKFTYDKPIERLDPNINWLRNIVVKLVEIEEMLDLEFPSILNIAVDDNLANTISHVHAIAKKGVIRGKYTNFTSTLEKMNLDFFKSKPALLEGAEYMVKQVASDYMVHLLGKEIHFGPVLRFVGGSLSDECVSRIKLALDNNDDGPIKIEFVPTNSNEVVDFFPDFMRSLKPIKKYDPSFKLDQLERKEGE